MNPRGRISLAPHQELFLAGKTKYLLQKHGTTLQGNRCRESDRKAPMAKQLPGGGGGPWALRSPGWGAQPKEDGSPPGGETGLQGEFPEPPLCM